MPRTAESALTHSWGRALRGKYRSGKEGEPPPDHYSAVHHTSAEVPARRGDNAPRTIDEQGLSGATSDQRPAYSECAPAARLVLCSYCGGGSPTKAAVGRRQNSLEAGCWRPIAHVNRPTPIWYKGSVDNERSEEHTSEL